jgi:polyhydroxyalkanoate synthesis regulator phasin
MNTKIQTPEIEIEELDEVRNVVVDVTQKVVRSGLGAAAMAQEEWLNLFNKAVTRGEEVEAKGRDLVKDVTEKSRTRIEEGQAKVKGMVKIERKPAVAVEELPTKADIDALTKKVTALTKKVDALAK